MSIQYFKKERGGVGLVGYEVPHIYKDPPKAYFTRKKERVNIADVKYMMESDNPYGDPTRINEGIQMYARGQNPMVEVSYQNAGAASMNSSLGNRAVSNPYKVEVVRMPLTPIEARVPLSNPRIHQNYSITTNPNIVPQTIAGNYDKSVVRLMTDGYTLSAGGVRTNLNRDIQMNQERFANKMARELNQKIMTAANPTHVYKIDKTRDATHKQIRETKDAINLTATAGKTFNLDKTRDVNTKQARETKDAMNLSATAGKTFNLDKTRDVNIKQARETRDVMNLSATAGKTLNLDKTRDVNNKQVREVHDQTNLVSVAPTKTFQLDTREKSKLHFIGKENIQTAVVPTHAYHIDMIRDKSDKYVQQTKDILAIASTSPISFTDIVVFDPRTNTNVSVEANIREKNAIAVTAQASQTLIFNKGDGTIIKLSDYTYKTVVAPAGNTQMVIQIHQPEVVLDRSSPLYAASTNLMLKGWIDNQSGSHQSKILSNVLPTTTATTSLKINNYDDAAFRQSNDPTKFNLVSSLQTEGKTNMTLNAQGYNDEGARSGKVKELDKLNAFGSYEDRVSKPNFMIRGLSS